MKILILKPSSLGDVILALPVLRLIKLHSPSSQVFWWLDVNLAPLLDGDPDITGIFRFQRKRWAAPHHWGEIATSLRDMRAHRFDYTIDLQGLARSSIFAWIAKPALNIGLDNPREGVREGARALYDITPPPAPPRSHAVDRYLAVLPLINVPVHQNFDWLPIRPNVAARVRQQSNLGSNRLILLLPGARWFNKLWPVAHFIQLVRLMRAIPNLNFVILGSRDHQPLGEQIAAADPARCRNIAGQTSLIEMIEWVRLGSLVITNDTGPMHVAAAIQKPLIALFGPTSPDNAGPYGQRENVFQITSIPCVPCLKSRCAYSEPLACLHAITPQMVFEKARRMLMSGS